MITTAWFLVVLAMFPDHAHLDRSPVEFSTQKICSTEGMGLMIDRRNKSLKVYCIEADDWLDLSNIMNEAFNFGGQHI